MLKLLAIETATEACSCALLHNGEPISRYAYAPRRHAEIVLQMVSEVLAEGDLSVNDLDGFAFGRGPGSFTGVRIATGVVQGLAFGADLTVAPVSSLRALAQGVFRQFESRSVLAAFDARMSEVYWGCFAETNGLMSAIGDEGVFAPGEVPLPESAGEWFGAGSGWGAYESILRARVGRKLSGVDAKMYPHALDVACLGAEVFAAGQAVSAEEALPVYLRDQVTQPRNKS